MIVKTEVIRDGKWVEVTREVADNGDILRDIDVVVLGDFIPRETKIDNEIAILMGLNKSLTNKVLELEKRIKNLEEIMV